MECPFIDRAIVPDPETNVSRVYITSKDASGVPCEDYTFYDHYDSDGRPHPVQFCSLRGRKRDIFECLNESEWKGCGHYLLAKTLGKEHCGNTD